MSEHTYDNPLEIEPHTHRAIIGFDKNGIPKVLQAVSGHSHTHVDEDGNTYTHTHEGDFCQDYMQAVAAYRKTFPSKQDVLDQTPDPAVREMLLRAEQIGIDTALIVLMHKNPNVALASVEPVVRFVTWAPVKLRQNRQKAFVEQMPI